MPEANMETNCIVNADCLEYMRTLPDESVEMRKK